MSGHTPGPWRVAGPDNALEGWKVTDTGPTQDHDGDGASEYIATAYDGDNLPLIVAAPIMANVLMMVAAVPDDDTDCVHCRTSARLAVDVLHQAGVLP